MIEIVQRRVGDFFDSFYDCLYSFLLLIVYFDDRFGYGRGLGLGAIFGCDRPLGGLLQLWGGQVFLQEQDHCLLVDIPVFFLAVAVTFIQGIHVPDCLALVT
jgi:hypothetical protein